MVSMTFQIIFIISGLGIALLIWAKVWEERRHKKPLLLRLVSMGDEHVRTLSHEMAHRYSELKEELHFFWHKQLPLHTKNIFNKTRDVIKERAEKHIGDIRGSKFLRKNDGLSEFFKSISEKENGRIDEDFDGE
jgi:hypothetical protein